MVLIKAIKTFSLYICLLDAMSPIDLWEHPCVLHVYPSLPGKDDKNS